MVSGFGRKNFTMDKLITYKILIGLLTCSLIVTISVICFLSFKKCNTLLHDNLETASLLGLDWYCETAIGTPCKYPSTISGVGWKDHFHKGRTYWNCTDRNRQVSETYDVCRMYLNNSAIYGVCKCMDLNYKPQVPEIPCLIDFDLCIEDPHVSAMTLKCRYLKDLKPTGNQYWSSDNQSATCDTDGTVYTYYMNTGYSTWRVEFNNEKLHFEKPMPPNSTETTEDAVAM